VIASCGHSFSKNTITEWLSKNGKDTCPLCTCVLDLDKDLRPNYTLRETISRYLLFKEQRRQARRIQRAAGSKPTTTRVPHTAPFPLSSAPSDIASSAPSVSMMPHQHQRSSCDPPRSARHSSSSTSSSSAYSSSSYSSSSSSSSSSPSTTMRSPSSNDRLPAHHQHSSTGTGFSPASAPFSCSSSCSSSPLPTSRSPSQSPFSTQLRGRSHTSAGSLRAVHGGLTDYSAGAATSTAACSSDEETHARITTIPKLFRGLTIHDDQQRDLNDEVEELPVISLLVRVLNARNLLSEGWWCLGYDSWWFLSVLSAGFCVCLVCCMLSSLHRFSAVCVCVCVCVCVVLPSCAHIGHTHTRTSISIL
jgi:hypothetical protein